MAKLWFMIGVWCKRIIYPFVVYVLISILRREIAKQQQDKIENIPNQYKKWMNRFSVLSMLCSILAIVFWVLGTVPYICMYTYGIGYTLWTQTSVFLTLYQTVRLQFCFSSNQIHSIKYGYSDYTFKILYINGILFLFFPIIASWFIYYPINLHLNGCELYETDNWYLIIAPGVLWYYMWDITILLMYIFKIYQINSTYNKDNKNNKNVEIILKKIKYILHKVVLLTIIYELQAFITVSITNATSQLETANIVETVIASFDALINVFVMFLMIEHNDSEYIKVIKISVKYHLCFCCKSLIDKELLFEDVIRLQNSIILDISTPNDNSIGTKTCTIIQIPNTHKSYESREDSIDIQ